jgi:hypothetical protein
MHFVAATHSGKIAGRIHIEEVNYGAKQTQVG